MNTQGAGPVLILGGTAQARELAGALVAAGRPVVSSLAGRVRDPARPDGEVRVGGFSSVNADGVAGLAAFLVEHRVAAMIDATHPFAVTISANAAAAAARTEIPWLRLQRPGWWDHPDATRWTWVGSPAEAVLAGAGSRRPFLTTGRQSLPDFLAWADRDVTVRVVDPPEIELPASWRVIRSRGPYAYADERALIAGLNTDLLVTKDSGGSHTAAKLDAARDLGVAVIMVARPGEPSPAPTVATVAEVLDWLP
ncbi:MAG: cobalt-precorrin-6A reductase [Microlunatus sp.]|nr:cobalt-precorrin-6A reductase [Microlunatus sp.]